jgi:hypothetical protein
MAFKEVVTQLVANREAPETVAWIARAIHDAEVISDSHETSRDAGVERGILLMQDVFRIRDLEWIDRQFRDVLLLEHICSTGFCFPPRVNQHVSPFFSGLLSERAWPQMK